MKAVEELKGITDKSIIAVLTGNGRTEHQVLKPLAERYDGDKKVLLLPTLPIHLRPSTGLSVLQAVKTYASKYKIMHTLFLVDREHFSERDVGKEIVQTLRSFGIVDPHKLGVGFPSGALVISGLMGRHRITIHVAVFGKEKCLEEEIAKLIDLELKIRIRADKKEIRGMLHKRNLDIYTLVKKAQKRSLLIAFPSLTSVLKKIEKNLN